MNNQATQPSAPSTRNARVYEPYRGEWYWVAQDEHMRDLAGTYPRGPFKNAVAAGRDARAWIVAGPSGSNLTKEQA